MLAVEIGLVVWLALEYERPWPGLCVFAALLTGYALYTLYHLGRGRRDLQRLPFGATPNSLVVRLAVTNLGIAALSLVLGRLGQHGQLGSHVAGAQVPGLAVIGVLLGAGVINLPLLTDLLRRTPEPASSTDEASPSSAPRPR
jgi:hypothetical protein